MDQQLLRSYFSTIYELPTGDGVLRASLDGETVKDPTALPELLRTQFALLTAYNPRSMLLPRRVNEARHHVMRDMLILGCYRVEPCVGYEPEKKESVWREPAWIVHGMDRQEVIAFGRVFRQNVVLYSVDARPSIVITDPTADDVGRTFDGHWRPRA